MIHGVARVGAALGVMFLGLGAALSIRTVQATVVVILVIVLQPIGGPVGTHLLGRAVYRKSRPVLIGPDELSPVVDDESG